MAKAEITLIVKAHLPLWRKVLAGFLYDLWTILEYWFGVRADWLYSTAVRLIEDGLTIEVTGEK